MDAQQAAPLYDSVKKTVEKETPQQQDFIMQLVKHFTQNQTQQQTPVLAQQHTPVPALQQPAPAVAAYSQSYD